MSSLFLALFSLLVSHTLALPASRRFSARNNHNNGHLVPFKRQQGPGTVVGTIGLGDNSDLLYTITLDVGGTTTTVNLDTGSSDLWVVSSDCTLDLCANSHTTGVPANSLQLTGADVTMRYGDSATGTSATGPLALDTIAIAGVAIQNQLYAAVNDTTNTVVSFGAAGIFGLGFPSESRIQEAQVVHQFGLQTTTDHFVASTYANGPLVARIAQSGELEMPMFAISLQRDTIDISGTGALTLGALPQGVDNSSITWVPVRLYTGTEGGIEPPTFAPDEVYPLRWEVDLDAVFLDGQELPASTIPATGGVSSTRMSALLDTGNSILRGPSDVVTSILTTISPNYSPADATSATLACATAHNLTFQIGGKMFPIDPRDLISPASANNAENCIVDNIVATDAPGVGALFRWSLGDPFFKSNLVVFHYGNLTHPSQDPPRIGILSQVPANAADLLNQAVQSAQANGGDFDSTLINAPTEQVETQPDVTVSPGAASAQAAALTNTHTHAPTIGTTVGNTAVEAQPTPSAKGTKTGAAAATRIPWLLALAAAAFGAVATGW